MFAILFLLIGITALFYCGSLSRKIAPHSEVKRQFIYQVATLGIAIFLVTLNRLTNNEYASTLARGDSALPTSNLSIIGIKDGTPWSEIGPTFVLIPLIVTAVVVYLQTLKGMKINWKYAPIAIMFSTLFSLVNSLTEELIFRVIPIEGLYNHVSVPLLAILCGVAFGIPHYFGNPGRIPGVLMAGFLGWIAGLSILETGGIAWAWGIHFAQDVPIILMLLLKERGNHEASH